MAPLFVATLRPLWLRKISTTEVTEGHRGKHLVTWHCSRGQVSESADRLLASQCRQKLSRRFAELGIAHLRSDLNQRFQNEAPLMHCWMRNLQAGFIHHAVPKQHHVAINLALTFLAQAETSHASLHRQRNLEHVARPLSR